MKSYKSIEKSIRSNPVFFKLMADKLGITQRELHLKLKSPLTFTMGELAVIKRLFNLPVYRLINFFAPAVAFCNHIH